MIFFIIVITWLDIEALYNNWGSIYEKSNESHINDPVIIINAALCNNFCGPLTQRGPLISLVW